MRDAWTVRIVNLRKKRQDRHRETKKERER